MIVNETNNWWMFRFIVYTVLYSGLNFLNRLSRILSTVKTLPQNSISLQKCQCYTMRLMSWHLNVGFSELLLMSCKIVYFRNYREVPFPNTLRSIWWVLCIMGTVSLENHLWKLPSSEVGLCWCKGRWRCCQIQVGRNEGNAVSNFSSQRNHQVQKCTPSFWLIRKKCLLSAYKFICIYYLSIHSYSWNYL